MNVSIILLTDSSKILNFSGSYMPRGDRKKSWTPQIEVYNFSQVREHRFIDLIFERTWKTRSPQVHLWHDHVRNMCQEYFRAWPLDRVHFQLELRNHILSHFQDWSLSSSSGQTSQILERFESKRYEFVHKTRYSEILFPI